MAQTFGSAPPRIGKTTAKSVGSSGPKMSVGGGVKPKLGRNFASVGPSVGKAVIGTDVKGTGLGKARVVSAPKGMGGKGLLGTVK